MQGPESSSPFKAGFVALLGRPNAGKSTLLNALLRAKLSIVSPQPQTTRHKIMGILDGEGYQVCFLDTPGLLARARDLLQESLKHAAKKAAHDDADIQVLIVEPGVPSPEELSEVSWVARPGVPLILALNKTDLPAGPALLDETLKAYCEALKPAAAVRISARKGSGLPELLQEILARLPEAPDAYYDKGILSDRWERFFAAEIVREQVFALYREEVPHAVAVVIELFKEQKGAPDEVHATLYVERDGQKGIVLGKGGQALKRLRERSESALRDFLGRPVELELWVKVRKDWRKDPRSLKEFGYAT
jgi:GTP-binding protein Era